jgi:hypothetical protein
MSRHRSDLETCPRCGKQFSAATNRVHPNAVAEAISGKWIWTKITDSALVSCPRCSHRFPSNQVRFFGFLSLRQVRLLFLLYLAAFLAVALFVAVASGEVSNMPLERAGIAPVRPIDDASAGRSAPGR